MLKVATRKDTVQKTLPFKIRGRHAVRASTLNVVHTFFSCRNSYSIIDGCIIDYMISIIISVYTILFLEAYDDKEALSTQASKIMKYFPSVTQFAYPQRGS